MISGSPEGLRSADPWSFVSLLAVGAAAAAVRKGTHAGRRERSHLGLPDLFGDFGAYKSQSALMRSGRCSLQGEK